MQHDEHSATDGDARGCHSLPVSIVTVLMAGFLGRLIYDTGGEIAGADGRITEA